MQGIPDYSVDDAMVVNARFASGALASFSTGCFPLKDHSELPGGGIGLSLSSRNHRIVLSGWGMEGAVYSGDSNKKIIPSEEDIFLVQNRAFLNAVENGDPSGIHSTYEDGMKTLATTLAANESARKKAGAPVAVSL